MERLLTICIPTYNRKDVIVNTVNSYLDVKDNRFCVNICDNCSTDTTYEELSKICDDRLIICRNEENIGYIPNAIKSMESCNSKYIIFIIDKDVIDTSKLLELLDFFETESPYFGYVNLDINRHFSVYKTIAGAECVNCFAFQNQHPSGIFYRTDIYNHYSHNSVFERIDKGFDFYWDLLNGLVACKYDGTRLDGGFVINANLRDIDNKKSSFYNEDNIWFGYHKRKYAYIQYLDVLLASELKKNEKVDSARVLTDRMLHTVTDMMRDWLSDDKICTHYGLKPRNATSFELMWYSVGLLGVFLKKTMFLFSLSDTISLTFHFAKTIIHSLL